MQGQWVIQISWHGILATQSPDCCVSQKCPHLEVGVQHPPTCSPIRPKHLTLAKMIPFQLRTRAHTAAVRWAARVLMDCLRAYSATEYPYNASCKMRQQQYTKLDTIPSLKTMIIFKISCNCERRLPSFDRSPNNPLWVIFLTYFMCSSISVSSVQFGFDTANTKESHEDSMTYCQAILKQGTTSKRI